MSKVMLVEKDEHYWLRNDDTKEIVIGVCVSFHKQGAVMHELCSSIRRSIRSYTVLAHIPFPVEPLDEVLLTIGDEPAEPPLTDEEDWDDGEWEQDIYDAEEDWDDEDWDEEEE